MKNLSDPNSKLSKRIIFHYQENSDLSNYMDVRRNGNQNFEPIRYTAVLKNFTVPTNDSDIDDLAKQIARDLVGREFSHFVGLLGKIDCNTTETTLENLVNTVDQVYDDLWDNGYEVDQLYMPFLLKREIRKRKNSNYPGIMFSTKTLYPTIVRELGNNQIVFSNKHGFGKTYPNTTEEQILVSNRRGIRHSEIDCEIVQKLDVRSLDVIARILVTDIEKSKFQ